jgi:hypothetical protein
MLGWKEHCHCELKVRGVRGANTTGNCTSIKTHENFESNYAFDKLFQHISLKEAKGITEYH